MTISTLTQLKPRYTTVADLEQYIDGFSVDDESQILRRLSRAERYIDLLGAGNPITQADPIQSLVTEFKTPPTGGRVKVAWTINGVQYISGAIPYNATYADVRESINVARSAGGVLIPSGVLTYMGPLTPYVPSGPLPFIPVVIAFAGNLGARELLTGAITESALTGGSEVTPKVVTICPGGPWGGRFNPSLLLMFNQLQALKNAVCAQYEYMVAQGDRFFVDAQYESVKGPEFTTRGRLPKIAPKARLELSISGLMTTTARSRP